MNEIENCEIIQVKLNLKDLKRDVNLHKIPTEYRDLSVKWNENKEREMKKKLEFKTFSSSILAPFVQISAEIKNPKVVLKNAEKYSLSLSSVLATSAPKNIY